MPMPRLIAVMGPTASGKTELAEALANRLDAQLINADAFQVYRGMDIGTSKPGNREKYQLLDLKEPNEGFGVGEWLPLAHALLETNFEAQRNVVVVGGTGLYIRALFEEYGDMAESPDPELRARLVARIASEGLESLYRELQTRAPEIAAKIDAKNPARVRRALERLDTPNTVPARVLPSFVTSKLVISHDKQELNNKIHLRVKLMLQNGWLEEVEGLRSAGFGPGDPGFRALGYCELWQHLAGAINMADAQEAIERNTRQYAKRQRSWLRSEPNTTIVEGTETVDLINVVSEALGL